MQSRLFIHLQPKDVAKTSVHDDITATGVFATDFDWNYVNNRLRFHASTSRSPSRMPYYPRRANSFAVLHYVVVYTYITYATFKQIK